MIDYLRRIYNPTLFQGSLKKQRYFEGWYFKFVSTRNDVCAFIPGISLSDKGRYAFIQYIDGKSGETTFVQFPLEVFRFNPKKFEVWIGDNYFSNETVSLHINDLTLQVRGEIKMKNHKKLPSKILWPGIMGWYSFMPFMECYHGLVSMDHDLEGAVEINGKGMNFSGGRGYIEKDWGRSMPQSWIWIQSNTFTEKSASVMFSLAKIPWLSGRFDGFLCVLMANGVMHRFATYTGARILKVFESENIIEIKLGDKNFVVNIRVERTGYGKLAAPVFGEMSRIIHESINSVVRVTMRTKQGEIVFDDTGYSAGCEVVGDAAFNTIGSAKS
jgi:tocopherol cyclase